MLNKMFHKKPIFILWILFFVLTSVWYEWEMYSTDRAREWAGLYHTGSLSPIHISVAFSSLLIAICYCTAMHWIQSKKESLPGLSWPYCTHKEEKAIFMSLKLLKINKKRTRREGKRAVEKLRINGSSTATSLHDSLHDIVTTCYILYYVMLSSILYCSSIIQLCSTLLYHCDDHTYSQSLPIQLLIYQHLLLTIQWSVLFEQFTVRSS